MRNIMFDVAASIVTEKKFEDLTVEELCAAVERRLSLIRRERSIESFGFCDEYDDDASGSTVECHECGKPVELDDSIWVDPNTGEATTGERGRPFHVECAPGEDVGEEVSNA